MRLNYNWGNKDKNTHYTVRLSTMNEIQIPSQATEQTLSISLEGNGAIFLFAGATIALSFVVWLLVRNQAH